LVFTTPTNPHYGDLGLIPIVFQAWKLSRN
jgi:hypothetical protein